MAHRPRRKKNGLDITTILLLLGVGGAALYAVSAKAAPKEDSGDGEGEGEDTKVSDDSESTGSDASTSSDSTSSESPAVIQGPATATTDSQYSGDLADPNFGFIIVKASEGGTLYLNEQAIVDVGPVNETRIKVPAPGAYTAYVRFLDGSPSATKTIGVVGHSVGNWYFSRDAREQVASKAYTDVASTSADAVKAAAYAMLGEAESLMRQKQYANALKKYDDIINKYPATPYAKSAQILKAALTIQLRAGQKVEGVK